MSTFLRPEKSTSRSALKAVLAPINSTATLPTRLANATYRAHMPNEGKYASNILMHSLSAYRFTPRLQNRARVNPNGRRSSEHCREKKKSW